MLHFLLRPSVSFPQLSSPVWIDLRLTIFGGLLFCVSPMALSAQTVSFAGSTPSVNFGNVNLCAAGQTTPAPCSATLALNYHVTASGTLGPIQVVTSGQPNLDFTLAGGSTCSGAVTAGQSCVVNVNFAPRFAGTRPGGVLITDESGKALATTLVYGTGVGPQLGFDPGTPVRTPISLSATDLGLPAAPNNVTSAIFDGAGDIFVGASLYFTQGGFEEVGGVTELPVGGGPQIRIPFTGLSDPFSLAVDGAGDVFVVDEVNGQVLERPAGGGAQVVLPLPGADSLPYSVAVDPMGNVFVGGGYSFVVKFPAGGGAPVTLPFHSSDEAIFLVSTDGAGDLFVSDHQTLNELLVGATKPIFLGTKYLETVDTFGNYYILTAGGLQEFPVDGGSPFLLPGIGSSWIYIYNGDFVFGGFLGGIPESEGFGLTDQRRSQPSVLNFGAVSVGSTATLPLAITNTGNANLTATASLNSSNYKILSATPANCLAGIAPSQICTLDIQYSPTTPGAHDEYLSLSSSAVNAPSASVSLTGADYIAAPVLSLTSGVYTTSQTVSITGAAPGATIYYTTNGTTPTAASTPYTGPITVASTERLTAVAILDGTPSAIATAAYTIAPAPPTQSIDFSAGFARAASSMRFNGNTGVSGSTLLLTTAGKNEAGSAFYTTPMNVQAFSTDFSFQVIDPIADGFTFTIQNEGVGALGSQGGGLGFEGISHSVALKFDFHNNDGEGANSTGLYIDGAPPTVPAINLTGTGLNLRSGHSFLAQITYNGALLTLSLTDAESQVTWSHSFAIDIPATVGGNTAYLGFTGGTGTEVAHQEVLSWTYVALPPGSAVPSPPLPLVPNNPGAIDGIGLALNGSASFTGTTIELTNGAVEPHTMYAYVFEAGSAFYSNPVNIASFSTAFTFQLTAPPTGGGLDGISDGFTFTLQNSGLGALGGDGKSLGYGGIANSVAIKFDLYNNAGEGANSTGLFVDGALPTVPAVDLTGTGIDLHSGDPITAYITYNGTNLVMTLTDTITGATYTRSFPIDIPSTVGGSTAYVGFTGGTGTAIQQILNWTFTNP